ncbi:substrate-binding periplasmic protein [Nisaea denitrificans]|uniref:substrate-binding periplasmic protein n=1 Tax=Nisaea denitrificans TaxID=390877 RepID=UPI0003FE9A16|nr:transporter substrate-binding domain-containing protein [Nisaea denitrificans]
MAKSFFRVALPAFIALVFCFSEQGLAEAEKIRFSASVGMPFSNDENTGFEDRLTKEMFRRIGRDVEVRFVPAERALINLNDGLDDGALGRVKGVLKNFPGIVEIPEEAFVRDFVVFTRNARFVPSDWTSLAPYNVGYVNGWKILERNVRDAKSVVLAADGPQLFELLDRGRVDLVIYNRWGGLQQVRDMGLRGIHLLEPPLARAPHYFVLNVRHRDLAEPAARALRDMKADGSYQKIFEETLAHLARQ